MLLVALLAAMFVGLCTIIAVDPAHLRDAERERLHTVPTEELRSLR